MNNASNNTKEMWRMKLQADIRRADCLCVSVAKFFINQTDHFATSAKSFDIHSYSVCKLSLIHI
jgi:hypothetical protein